jgi:hypothetical protein
MIKLIEKIKNMRVKHQLNWAQLIYNKKIRRRNIMILIIYLNTIAIILRTIKPIASICKIVLHCLILSFGGGSGYGQ